MELLTVLLIAALASALSWLWVGFFSERDETHSIWGRLTLATERRVDIAAAVPDELCKVEGSVVTDQELLTSPSGERCVWYRLHVFHIKGTGKSAQLVTDFVRERAVAFQLEDDSGRIAVETHGARFVCAPLYSGPWEGAYPELREHSHGADAQFDETIVAPGDRLIFYGRVVAGDPRTIGGWGSYVDKRKTAHK